MPNPGLYYSFSGMHGNEIQEMSIKLFGQIAWTIRKRNNIHQKLNKNRENYEKYNNKSFAFTLL